MANEVKFKINLNVDGKDRVVTAITTVDELRNAVNQASDDTKKLRENLINTNQITEAWNNVSNAISQLSGVLNDLTAESRSFGAAMAAANTMAGKSGEDFANLKDQVAELSKQIPIARDELANGLYQVVSNGVPEDNWIEYLNQSARASVGGIADLGETVKVTSTIIKNYGLQWSDAETIQDKIQLTAKNGVTSFEQLAQALPRVTSQASTLGVSIDELMGTFSTLTGVSGNTAEVSTQLAAIFTALIKPSSEATEMAQQMGIQFDAAAIKAAGGMEQFLVSLDKSVKQYSESSGMLEQEVYGKLFGSAESLRAITPLVGNLSSTFQKNVNEMKDSAGTMDEAYQGMSSTGAAAFQMMKNSFAGIADTLSSVVGGMLPYLNIVSQFGMSVNAVMALRQAYIGLGGAAGLASTAIATCNKAVAIAIATSKQLAAVFTGLASGPLAVLVVGLGALAGGYAIAKDCIEDTDREARELRKTLAEMKKQHDDNTAAIREYLPVAQNATKSIDERKKAIAKLKSLYPDYFKNLNIATSKQYDLADAIRTANAAYREQLVALAKQAKAKYEQSKALLPKHQEGIMPGAYSGSNVMMDQEQKGVVEANKKAWQEAEKAVRDYDKAVKGTQTTKPNKPKGDNTNKPKQPKVNQMSYKQVEAAIEANTNKTGTTARTNKSKNTPKAKAKPEPNPLQDSIDWYDKAIAEKQKELKASANEATSKVLNNQLEGLQRELYMLKVRVGIESVPPIEVKKAVKPMSQQIKESFDDMQRYLEQNPLHVEADPKKLKKFTDSLEDLDKIKNLGNIDLSNFESVKGAIQGVSGITDHTAKGFAAAGASCQAMGNALQQLGSDSEAAKAGLIMAALGQLALSFAQAMSDAAKSSWVTWLAFGIAGTAQLVSMVATISQFATGGIVGGNQTSGDKVLVRVNSGEMILNAAQQARLFALANGTALYGAAAQVQTHFAAAAAQPTTTVDARRLQAIMTTGAPGTPQGVNLRLRGRDLVGVLANETRTNRKRTNIRL